MSQTISRMYATYEQASSAVAALRDQDYSDIHLVPAASADASPDVIVAAITKGYVLKSNAKIYAERVRRGGSLVTVHAPFGGAELATRILDKFHPIDSGISEPEYPIRPWDDSTPMSSILQMPVLLDDAAPFSKFWNVTPLTDGPAWFSSLFGLPLLSRPKSSFTSSFGLPLLSNDPAPLSSLLHLPTVAKAKPVR